MRLVYIYGANVDVPGYKGGYIAMARDMLRSLRRYGSAEKVCCCWQDPDADVEYALRDVWPGPLELIDLRDLGFPPDRHYSDYRLWALGAVRLADGDELLRMECDMLCLGDPFDAFEWEFAVGFTQRPWWFGPRPVNIGLVGFRGSPETRGFIREWCAEAREPKFPSMVEIEKQSVSEGWGWTREEMYPWAMLRHGMGNLQVALLPGEFNWTPSEITLEDETLAHNAYRERWQDPRHVRVIHFKTQDKSIMQELAA